MTKPLVRLVKLNNLQYNANRDPQVYRRPADQPFRIQALLEGRGAAHCRLTDPSGHVLVQREVQLPGTFTHELAFGTPGTRLVTLAIEGGGQAFSQNLRLDVMDHAHAE